jgi:hypothetical protein
VIPRVGIYTYPAELTKPLLGRSSSSRSFIVLLRLLLARSLARAAVSPPSPPPSHKRRTRFSLSRTTGIFFDAL